MLDLIHLAIPAFILLVIAKAIVGSVLCRDLYEFKDAAASVAMGLGNVFVDLFAKVILFEVLTFFHRFAIFNIGYQWWAWTLLFFGDEFSYYWFQRVSHECRLFWASHVPSFLAALQPLYRAAPDLDRQLRSQPRRHADHLGQAFGSFEPEDPADPPRFGLTKTSAPTIRCVLLSTNGSTCSATHGAARVGATKCCTCSEIQAGTTTQWTPVEARRYSNLADSGTFRVPFLKGNHEQT
jgi:hypothetical protein